MTHPAGQAVSGLRRGLAVPCFAGDPAELTGLGVTAEQAGFDGFFLWDHLVFASPLRGSAPVERRLVDPQVQP